VYISFGRSPAKPGSLSTLNFCGGVARGAAAAGVAAARLSILFLHREARAGSPVPTAGVQLYLEAE
jgi:hypothetical protein